MTSIDSPFISQLSFVCHNSDNIYLGMKKALGGDLFSWMRKTTDKGADFATIYSQAIPFILAGIVLGMETLGLHEFIHRDIKV